MQIGLKELAAVSAVGIALAIVAEKLVPDLHTLEVPVVGSVPLAPVLVGAALYAGGYYVATNYRPVGGYPMLSST